MSEFESRLKELEIAIAIHDETIADLRYKVSKLVDLTPDKFSTNSPDQFSRPILQTKDSTCNQDLLNKDSTLVVVLLPNSTIYVPSLIRTNIWKHNHVVAVTSFPEQYKRFNNVTCLQLDNFVHQLRSTEIHSTLQNATLLILDDVLEDHKTIDCAITSLNLTLMVIMQAEAYRFNRGIIRHATVVHGPTKYTDKLRGVCNFSGYGEDTLDLKHNIAIW